MSSAALALFQLHLKLARAGAVLTLKECSTLTDEELEARRMAVEIVENERIERLATSITRALIAAFPNDGSGENPPAPLNESEERQALLKTATSAAIAARNGSSSNG